MSFQVPYPDEFEAKHAVKLGHAWAALSFPENYSTSLYNRLQEGRDAEDSTLDFSNIDVWMDASGIESDRREEGSSNNHLSV